MLGYMVQNESVRARLGRDEPKACQGGFARKIDFLGPYLWAPRFVFALNLRRTNGKIDDDDARKLLAMQSAGLERYIATEAVTDDSWRAPHVGIGTNGHDFAGEELTGIVSAVTAVAHATEINRCDKVVLGE